MDGKGKSLDKKDSNINDTLFFGELDKSFQGNFASGIIEVLKPYFSSRSLRKGEILWRKDEKADLMVVLISGKIKIYKLLSSGKEITIYIFGSGTVFGFMPFFDGGTYPAYAQSIEGCEILVITKTELPKIIQSNPRVALFLIKYLSERLREALNKIETLSSKGSLSKVAASLYSLASQLDGSGGFHIISLPIMAAEYASFLGMSPETFSRGISALEAQSVIHRLKPNKFQVLNLGRLKELGGNNS